MTFSFEIEKEKEIDLYKILSLLGTKNIQAQINTEFMYLSFDIGREQYIIHLVRDPFRGFEVNVLVYFGLETEEYPDSFDSTDQVIAWLPACFHEVNHGSI